MSRSLHCARVRDDMNTVLRDAGAVVARLLS